MDIELNRTMPAAIQTMVSAWAEMWQLPRIVWARWCDIAIDAWVGALTGRPFIQTWR